MIYSLNQEELVFKNYSDQLVLKKVIEIEQDQELKKQLESHAIKQGVDIEILLFLEAIKVLHQKQNQVKN